MWFCGKGARETESERLGGIREGAQFGAFEVVGLEKRSQWLGDIMGPKKGKDRLQARCILETVFKGC